jgi:aspartate/methionine/tyrosine aminotransferase
MASTDAERQIQSSPTDSDVPIQPVDLVSARIRAINLPPFDPLNRRAAELRQAGHPVIALGQAVPHFPPPPAALDAARNAVDRPEVSRYATDPGLPSLRRVLAERLTDTLGGPVNAGELVITAGANHAFALTLATLVNPGDEVVLPGPYFTNHHMMVCALGAIAVEAPVIDRVTFSVTWDDIEPHLTARTKAIVLCNPSNPTGSPIDEQAGRRIVERAGDRGLAIISDETYMHFVYEGSHWSPVALAGWRRHVVVIGTFSKSFGMRGWRLGFVLADAQICEQAVKVQDAMIICAPVISQVAGEAAARDNWSYAASFHDEFRARRQVLIDGLATVPGIEWLPQRGGLFAFARVAGCLDSRALSAQLIEEAHVVTIPGAVFGTSGGGCLRLSYGVATVTELREAVSRLAAVLTSTSSPRW